MRLDNYTMKHNGMYILKKTDFDEIADMVLKEYMPNVLQYPKQTDVEYLAEECFYLEIKHDNITPNGAVLGMIAFADTEFNTVGMDYEERTIKLEEGTMLIDMSLIGRENLARKRFTEAHEISHWVCHRSYHSPTHGQYEFRRNTSSYVACRTENIEQYKKRVQSEKTEEDWEEWQADSLAAALLMPKDTFQIAFSEAMRNNGIWRGYLIAGVDNDKARKVIEELMHVFGVSFRAAQIRMMHLGMIRGCA